MSTIRRTFTVTVDTENWDLAYGTGTEADLVTEDVRSSLMHHVDSMLTGTGEGFGQAVKVDLAAAHKRSAAKRAARQA